MNLPFIGFVGKSRYSISGFSNNAGFILYIKDEESKETIMFTTENFSGGLDDFDEKYFFENFSDLRDYTLTSIAALMAAGLGLLNFSDFNFQMPYWYLKFFFHAIIFPLIYFLIFRHTFFLINVMNIFFSQKDVMEWHACEHKSITLLKAGLKPTITNLRSCPTTVMNCGTAITMISLECLNILVLLGAASRHLPIESRAIIVGISLMILISSIFFNIATHIQVTKTTLIIPVLALPAAALPLLIERIFALKEPSEEKLSQTSARLKKFLYYSLFFKEQPPA